MKIFDKNTFKVECGFFFFLNIAQEQSRSAVFEKEIINQDGFIENRQCFQHFMMPEIFFIPTSFVSAF